MGSAQRLLNRVRPEYSNSQYIGLVRGPALMCKNAHTLAPKTGPLGQRC